jgi:hypothetical protein
LGQRGWPKGLPSCLPWGCWTVSARAGGWYIYATHSGCQLLGVVLPNAKLAGVDLGEALVQGESF